MTPLLSKNFMGQGSPKAVRVRTLTGEELQQMLGELARSSNAQIVRKLLAAKGFTESQQKVSGMEIGIGEFDPVVFIRVPFADAAGTLALALYAIKGDKIQASAGIFNKGIDGHFVNAFDIQGGELRQRILKRSIEGTIVDQSTGQILVHAAASSDSCTLCRAICAGIRSLGCALSGALICSIICFADPPCFLICYILYALICMNGYQGDCDSACRVVGYC